MSAKRLFYKSFLIILDVCVEVRPQLVHGLLHVILQGGELLEVPVPNLILPSLEVGSQHGLQLVVLLLQRYLYIVEVLLAVQLLLGHILGVGVAAAQQSFLLVVEGLEDGGKSVLLDLHHVIHVLHLGPESNDAINCRPYITLDLKQMDLNCVSFKIYF